MFKDLKDGSPLAPPSESGQVLRALQGLTAERYKIIIQARTPLVLPSYKGSTFRGAFGHAFRKIACLDIGKALCQRCTNEKCIYGYVFESSPGETADKLKNLKDVPRPFVIEPPAEGKRYYHPGDHIEFNMTVFGKAVRFFSYFILAFKEMGKTGIGRGRGRFSVVRVEDYAGRQVYDSDSDVIAEDTGGTSWIDKMPDRPKSLGTLEMLFLTPTRIKIRGDLVVRPEFHVLTRSLLHRVSGIMCFHCDSEFNVDFQTLIAEAQRVSLKKADVSWVDWERFSSRQATRMKLGGFTGRMIYEGNIGPFYPLFYLGQFIHIGKNCTFGLGKYELVEE